MLDAVRQKYPSVRFFLHICGDITPVGADVAEIGSRDRIVLCATLGAQRTLARNARRGRRRDGAHHGHPRRRPPLPRLPFQSDPARDAVGEGARVAGAAVKEGRKRERNVPRGNDTELSAARFQTLDQEENRRGHVLRSSRESNIQCARMLACE